MVPDFFSVNSLRLTSLLQRSSFRNYSFWDSSWLQGSPCRDQAFELVFRTGLNLSTSTLLIGVGAGACLSLLAEPMNDGVVVHAFAEDCVGFQKNQKPDDRWQHLSLTEFLSESYSFSTSSVLFRLFQDMRLNEHILQTLQRRLPSGTQVQILGRKQDGIQSLQKRLAKTGLPVTCLEVGCHSRWLTVEIRETPLISVEENSEVNGAHGSMKVPAGVFASGQCDTGTQLLLDVLQKQNGVGLRVWDLGCGAGWLAVQALQQKAAYVLATDHAFWSQNCTQENLQALGMDSKRWKCLCTFLDDGVEERFDWIISNPPFHLESVQKMDIGKTWLQVCRDHLNPGGRIFLVCNRFIPYQNFCAELQLSCRQMIENRSYAVFEIQV